MLEKFAFALIIIAFSCQNSTNGSQRTLPASAKPSSCISFPEGTEIDGNLLTRLDKDYSAEHCQLVLSKIEGSTNLNIEFAGVSNLRILEHLKFKSLKGIFAFGNKISDITPLMRFSDINHLDVSNNNIKDLQPLSSLVNLTSLVLSHNRISSLEDLKNLRNLRRLEFSENLIEGIDPVENMTDLTHLDASENLIKDLDPIVGLKKLEKLYLSRNPIPLEKCPISGAPQPITQYCKLEHERSSASSTPWIPR